MVGKEDTGNGKESSLTTNEICWEENLLTANNQVEVIMQDMDKDLDAKNNHSIYGPWMMVQKVQRKKSNFPKAKDRLAAVNKESGQEFHSQANLNKDRTLLLGSGSRFSALEIPSEELVNGLDFGPNEGMVDPLVEKSSNELKQLADHKEGSAGPKLSSNKARDNKGKSNKQPVNQRARQTKPNPLEKPSKDFRFGSNSSNVQETGTDASKKEIREAQKQKEQDMLRIISRKQSEMWRDYKEGKNVDDFLGCVGVHIATKDLEFIKEHSVKEKLHKTTELTNASLSKSEAMANLDSSLANDMVANASKTDMEAVSAFVADDV
ncbi:hypothetical protein RIF29_18899 [Crotalaria pallida]|uniref:Uncharacterized protein n=1 Tax=Crotalaria pallida TaxID=3830 RepID=A0AAN9I511_CROPI